MKIHDETKEVTKLFKVLQDLIDGDGAIYRNYQKLVVGSDDCEERLTIDENIALIKRLSKYKDLTAVKKPFGGERVEYISGTPKRVAFELRKLIKHE